MKLLLFLLPLIYSCSKSHNPNKWLMTINLQDQQLQSIIEIDKNTGTLYNSSEKLKLTPKESGYQIGTHYSVLSFDFENQKGLWIRENKDDYRVNFKIEPTNKTDLFKEYEQLSCKDKVLGKWKIQLSETKMGLGIFTQDGCRIRGSILTTTGDYRYLDGYLNNGQIHLQGFDGVFSFVFKLKLDNNKFTGKMYAGKSYNTEVSAIKDSNFKLSDANSMTNIKPHKRVELDTFDIFGNQVNINSKAMMNKPKVIQLFGSWCPNCLDETKFFNHWRKENQELSNKIEFIALAFENFKEEKKAIKALKKAQKELLMDYPLILIDYNKTIKPSDILPIDKARAFPTTLYLNKENKVIKVHTGFAGQATGIFFEDFTQDFDKTIKSLLQ